ncbi:hypothetical protein [Rhodopirellula europaea]|uniref:hypothetical protein n=1 Tax=Rhodopirellula europaea TaxID=1263866 RepID=UPI003D288522
MSINGGVKGSQEKCRVAYLPSCGVAFPIGGANGVESRTILFCPIACQWVFTNVLLLTVDDNFIPDLVGSEAQCRTQQSEHQQSRVAYHFHLRTAAITESRRLIFHCQKTTIPRLRFIAWFATFFVCRSVIACNLFAYKPAVRCHDKRITGVGCVDRQNLFEQSLRRRRDISTNTDISAASVVPEYVQFQMIFRAVIEHTIIGRKAIVFLMGSCNSGNQGFVGPLSKPVEMFGKDQSFIVSIHLQSAND